MIGHLVILLLFYSTAYAGEITLQENPRNYSVTPGHFLNDAINTLVHALKTNENEAIILNMMVLKANGEFASSSWRVSGFRTFDTAHNGYLRPVICSKYPDNVDMILEKYLHESSSASKNIQMYFSQREKNIEIVHQVHDDCCSYMQRVMILRVFLESI